MSQTPSYFVNSPSTGVNYYPSAGYYCLPNNATSVTATVRAWTGANGTGSLTSVNMTAIDRNVSGGTDTNSFTGSGNTVNATSSSGVNGSNVFCAGGKLNSGSVGSIEIYLTYTGSAIVPNVSGFSPSVGGPGTSVTITGSNFSGATAVQFNGTGASFSVDNDGQITATVPGGATTGPITVFNPSGSGTSGSNFTPSTLYCDDGSAFQACTVYADDGSNWQPAQVYVDDGSSWVQVA
jgi:hypothetical protein